MQYWTTEMEKQVGERVQIVLGDPAMRSLFERFGVGIFRRSSVFHGLARFLRQTNVRGARCFEVGTWNGLTAAVLSRHFDEVVSVDIAHNAEKHEVLSHLGITNVRCIDIESNDDKPGVFKKRGPFDFAYLDGDHHNDTHADWVLVKDCGRVLFHEAWPFQPPVWNLVQSLPEDQVTYGGAGLALWDASK